MFFSILLTSTGLIGRMTRILPSSSSLSIASIASEDNNEFIKSLIQGIFDRNGIHDATVQHRHSIDISYRRYERKAARSPDNVHNPCGRRLLLKVFGLAYKAV